MSDLLKMYGVKNKPGQQNVYNLAADSDLEACKGALDEIGTRIFESPDESFLLFYILCGRTMVVDGRKALILNFFDEPTSFYQMWRIDDTIREISVTFPNTY